MMAARYGAVEAALVLHEFGCNLGLMFGGAPTLASISVSVCVYDVYVMLKFVVYCILYDVYFMSCVMLGVHMLHALFFRG
jgi:hypothetical protein